MTLVVAGLILGGTLALTPFMKTNFLGSSGQNTFQVTQELPVGTSLDALDEASQPVEQVIRETEGVETVQTSIGSGGRGLAAALGGGGGATITYSVTTDEDADQEALQADVRSELDDLDDAGEITLAASSGFGASNDIEVDVTASNEEDLQAAADAVQEELDGLDSLVADLVEPLGVASLRRGRGEPRRMPRTPATRRSRSAASSRRRCSRSPPARS